MLLDARVGKCSNPDINVWRRGVCMIFGMCICHVCFLSSIRGKSSLVNVND